MNKYKLAVLAIVAFLIINVIIGIVGEQKEVSVGFGEEIPGSGGYCLRGYVGDLETPIQSVDISPCDSNETRHYSISPESTVPPGTVRDYILQKGGILKMPNGVNLKLESGNITEGRVVISVQKPPALKFK